MAKLKYPTIRIPKDYSYTVEEIAALYSISQKTVFRWIKSEGLVNFSYAKKFYIHSSELLSFLNFKNGKHKIKTPSGSIYCVKCQNPQKMKTRIRNIANKNTTAKCKVGVCPVCQTKCQQFINNK